MVHEGVQGDPQPEEGREREGRESEGGGRGCREGVCESVLISY